MILLALVACRADPEPKKPVDTDPPAVIDTDTDRDALAELVSPPDARDRDPDPDVLHVRLEAAEYVDLLLYNAQLPGPTLRAKVGDTLIVELENQMQHDTTIHWHGVDVPWAMDGVTWMQSPVAPGDSFTYQFELNQAGTFWYHPHFNTAQQVDRGLYGVLVVEEVDAPDVEDVIVVADIPNETTGGHDHRAAEDHAHGVASNWMLNGQFAPLALLAEVPRMRLINASNGGYLDLGKQRVIATDQGLLGALSEERLLLAPGDRAEIEFDGELNARPYAIHGGPALGESLLLVVGDPARKLPDWGFEAAPISPDPAYTDIVYTFQGGPGQWMINGETFPDVTVQTVALDDVVIIEVRNVSDAEHPFHLHGHSFEVLSIDGRPPKRRTIEDTVNVPIRGKVRLRVVANNPGDWMTHCHILEHAEDGMMTVLRVQ